MSDNETDPAPSFDQGNPPNGTGAEQDAVESGDGHLVKDWEPVPESAPFPGPEIPNADVNERGVFRFGNGKAEVFEWARIEVPIAPLFQEEQPIEWLWPERIPLGMVTLLEGASSAGKSLVVLDMAARVTSGKSWPGCVHEPHPAGDVLLLGGDPDSWERVVLPRLSHAGADLSRVGRCGIVEGYVAVETERKKAEIRRRLSFPHDLVMLEFNIRRRPETRLVVIDSLSAFCADDRAYRETLRQLDEIAARRHVAIVVTDRPKGRQARQWRPHECDRRADTVRVVFRVLIDPEDETLHHLAPVRMSFCAEPEWLPFQIGPKHVVGGGMIGWGPPAEAPPESAAPPGPAKERGAIRRMVIEWLRGMLLKSDMPIQRVNREAKQCGFSPSTLRRAREHLKVRMYRDQGGPFSSGWWTLRPKGWNGGAVPPDCSYDAVTLAEIQNWEGEAVESEEMVGESEPDGGSGAPETFCQPGKPDLTDRVADVSPGVGSNSRAARRLRRAKKAPASREIESDAAMSLSAENWEALRGPLLAEILGSRNGHSESNGKPKPK
jgi:hypothetical protein